MSRSQLLESMDSQELSLQKAYYRDRPFTHEMQELYFAQIASEIHNSNTGYQWKQTTEAKDYYLSAARKFKPKDKGDALKSWGSNIKQKEKDKPKRQRKAEDDR